MFFFALTSAVHRTYRLLRRWLSRVLRHSRVLRLSRVLRIDRGDPAGVSGGGYCWRRRAIDAASAVTEVGRRRADEWHDGLALTLVLGNIRCGHARDAELRHQTPFVVHSELLDVLPDAAVGLRQDRVNVPTVHHLPARRRAERGLAQISAREQVGHRALESDVLVANAEAVEDLNADLRVTRRARRFVTQPRRKWRCARGERRAHTSGKAVMVAATSPSSSSMPRASVPDVDEMM
jgi:hypothetical protein